MRACVRSAGCVGSGDQRCRAVTSRGATVTGGVKVTAGRVGVNFTTGRVGVNFTAGPVRVNFTTGRVGVNFTAGPVRVNLPQDVWE